MAIDGIILNKIKKNIEEHLPMHINKVSSFSNTEICINVHSSNKRKSLILSMHPEYCHIRLSNKTYNDFNSPSPFIMILRKYLTNGIVTDIKQYNYDRYLHLYIKNLNELYDSKNYLLVVELMGKYSNIILIDQDSNKIIDAYKKVPPQETSKRIIMPNVLYEQIDPQIKEDPFNKPNINIENSLVEQLQGFSKILEKEVRNRLKEASFESIMEEIDKSNKIYISESNYHIIPLKHLEEEYKEYDLIEGLDEIYYQKNEKEKIKIATDDIYKLVNKQIKHEKEKLAKLNNHLLSNDTYDEDKAFGELLFTYSNLNEKGLKEINVNDGNKEVKIKLDPKLSIKQNANKYYQKYTKKKKGIVYLNEQIESINNNIKYLEKINEELSIANHLDAALIKEDLIKNGYIKVKKQVNKKSNKINIYQISFNNHLITFGKNSIQNDYLTFKYAKKNHTFFHAKDYHGSHVIVDSDNLDEKTIRYAANLAAYFSKGRLSSSVPVDYCLVKDIKKISGASLGLVSIRNNKTIYIDPIKVDESLIRII